MKITKLKSTDSLPLTCSRKGVCCHGNLVLLNPWELHRLAEANNLSVRAFQDGYCNWSGIQLKFEGKKDSRGKAACNLYRENWGCSVHEARPLACRLFPLGRQIQNEVAEYIYQGATFPCLNRCAEVLDLPQLSVDAYLQGQKTQPFEIAQDAYLDFMQNTADMALMLLLDSGLAQSGDKNTLREWQKMSKESPEQLAQRIGQEWLDYLMMSDVQMELESPLDFMEQHQIFFQEKAQQKIDVLTSWAEISEFAVLMMALALFLAKALGANPQTLAELWIETAVENGAKI